MKGLTICFFEILAKELKELNDDYDWNAVWTITFIVYLLGKTSHAISRGFPRKN